MQTGPQCLGNLVAVSPLFHNQHLQSNDKIKSDRNVSDWLVFVCLYYYTSKNDTKQLTDQQEKTKEKLATGKLAASKK